MSFIQTCSAKTLLIVKKVCWGWIPSHLPLYLCYERLSEIFEISRAEKGKNEARSNNNANDMDILIRENVSTTRKVKMIAKKETTTSKSKKGK